MRRWCVLVEASFFEQIRPSAQWVCSESDTSNTACVQWQSITDAVDSCKKTNLSVAALSSFQIHSERSWNPRETLSAKYACVAQCWAIVFHNPSISQCHKSNDLTHNLLGATGKVMRRVIRLNGMICGIRKWSFLQTKMADPWTEDAAFSIQTKTRSGTISVEVLCSSVETHHVTALVTKSKERDGLWWKVKETIHWCTVKKLSRDARTILPNRFWNHALWFVLVECTLSIAQFCGESIGPANTFKTRRSRWWEGSTRFPCCFTCYGR